MQLSFLNEFTYFSNDEAIDRVVTKDGVRFVKLKDDETPYGLNELIQNISSEMFIVSDLHIGDPIDNWTDKRDKIISTINNIVGKNDKLLILGDLTAHSNTTNIYDVVNFIKCLKCENLYLILGNNDIYSIDSYKRMGFKAVVDKVIWRNYIFTHMPIRVYGKEINIHGHLHEEIRYENVDWHNHIRIWDDEYKPIKFREVLTRFESGYYKGVTMTSDELKAEWEAKQKIEEIETSINSVFDEIEKLSESYNISAYVKNIYNGNLSINNKIPLYEIYDGVNKDCGKPTLIPRSTMINKRLFPISDDGSTPIMIELFADYHTKFNDMIGQLDNILSESTTNNLVFYRENLGNDISIVYLDIQKEISEKLTVISDKRINNYFNTSSGLKTIESIIVSKTYMNSIMKSLSTYDPKIDSDIINQYDNAKYLYDQYITNKIYEISNTSNDARFKRNIDELMRRDMLAMLDAGKSDEYIVEQIKKEYFSDYQTKTEILTNASFRLHYFSDSLRVIKTALLYNVASIDDDIQRLIDLKSPTMVRKRIADEYERYVPQLTNKLGYTIIMPNGGNIINSIEMYYDIFNSPRDEQLMMLVNPVWYSINGYDYVIYGHGQTKKKFHDNYDTKFGRDVTKYQSNDDYYMQVVYYDGQIFGTLNSLVDHIIKKWKKDRPCRIMALVCNESPNETIPKLINQYSDPQCKIVDLSVTDSRIMLETTIDNIEDTQNIYNEVIDYCYQLSEDVTDLKNALLKRFDVLKLLGINKFYIQNLSIQDDGNKKCTNYYNYKEFKEGSMNLFMRFYNILFTEMKLNNYYMRCISNYIKYTGNLRNNQRKVAFVGIKEDKTTYRSINDYSGCLMINDDIVLEDIDLSKQKYIYVCSFRYKSIFGTAIRSATLSKYNHSTIALTEDLNPMYTYVREYPRASTANYDNKNGFAHEFLSDMLKKDQDSEVKVIAIPVTDEQYDTAKALIQGYEKNIEDTRYDFGNIVANIFRLKRNIYNLCETDMVCSEFVSYILYSIGFRGMSKSVNLTTPKDISQLDKKFIGAKCIYEGKVKDYKK